MLKNDARDEAINRAKLESKIAQIILELAELKKLVDNVEERRSWRGDQRREAGI